MELLQTALVVALLTITSATPMGLRDHHDADIPDKDWTLGQQDRNNWWLYQLRGSNSDSDSSESSETESSESSEEIFVERTTPVEATVAVTTAIAEDGSTVAPEPDTMATNGPTPTEQPGSPSPTVNATSPCSSGQCVIYEILTEAPTPDNRGDN